MQCVGLLRTHWKVLQTRWLNQRNACPPDSRNQRSEYKYQHGWILDMCIFFLLDASLLLCCHTSFPLCIFVIASFSSFLFLYWFVIQVFAHVCVCVWGGGCVFTYKCVPVNVLKHMCRGYRSTLSVFLVCFSPYYRVLSLSFWLDWLVNELLTLDHLHSSTPLLPNSGTTDICWCISLFQPVD